MAKNENSNFSYMTRRIGGTTYKVKVVFSDCLLYTSRYCRAVYEAGFSPIGPPLYRPMSMPLLCSSGTASLRNRGR